MGEIALCGRFQPLWGRALLQPRSHFCGSVFKARIWRPDARPLRRARLIAKYLIAQSGGFFAPLEARATGAAVIMGDLPLTGFTRGTFLRRVAAKQTNLPPRGERFLSEANFDLVSDCRFWLQPFTASADKLDEDDKTEDRENQSSADRNLVKD